MTKFASTFPGLDTFPTQDPRVFQTEWKRNTKNPDVLNAIKTKQYFCCIVSKGDGDNCYGVTVTRKMAVDARKQCEEALEKVKAAADYYEEHKTWPPNDNEN